MSADLWIAVIIPLCHNNTKIFFFVENKGEYYNKKCGCFSYLCISVMTLSQAAWRKKQSWINQIILLLSTLKE